MVRDGAVIGPDGRGENLSSGETLTNRGRVLHFFCAELYDANPCPWMLSAGGGTLSRKGIRLLSPRGRGAKFKKGVFRPLRNVRS